MMMFNNKIYLREDITDEYENEDDPDEEEL